MRSFSASSAEIDSSVAFMWVQRWRSIISAASRGSQTGIIAKGAPAANWAITLHTPNTPHSGGACSIAEPGTMSQARITWRAWSTSVRGSCSTNLGAFVVPEVVKMAQPASGLATCSRSGAVARQSA